MNKTFPSFDVALRRGQERERAFTAIFGSDRDLVTVECKSQVRARTHVFIETEGYGKPSGLAISTADYWAIEMQPNVWVLLKTDELRLLYQDALDAFGLSRGGDGGLSVGVSIPKAWFTQQKGTP